MFTTVSVVFANIGPNGSIKALVNSGQQLILAKEENLKCKSLQFTHPKSVLFTIGAFFYILQLVMEQLNSF